MEKKTTSEQQQQQPPILHQNPPPSPTTVGCCALRLKKNPPRPPQEIYFESRGKCCKKLLRYNGYPNKVIYIFLYLLFFFFKSRFHTSYKNIIQKGLIYLTDYRCLFFMVLFETGRKKKKKIPEVKKKIYIP